MDTTKPYISSGELRCNKAVCFLIYRRPDRTAHVFETIRKARPPRLYVVADGPRSDHTDEEETCQAARDIVGRGVDWECEVRTLYADINLGCRKRISSGLDWLFAQEEEAIILEDDCLPHQSFFRYCDELLDYYRTDERVMMIAGTNQRFDQEDKGFSYTFAVTGHIWGWASWRRAWQYYDVNMRTWPNIRDNNWLAGLNADLTHKKALKLWTAALDSVYFEHYDTWDWQWNLARWLQRGLTTIPVRNLVANIGFGAASTHTDYEHALDNNRPAFEMEFPLRHPQYFAGSALYESEPINLDYKLRKFLHKLRYRPDGTFRLPWLKSSHD